jgi:hypothetical protein
VSRARRVVAMAAAMIGVGGAVAAGYAAAGPTGLVDAAALATLGVLVLARGLVRDEKPPPVRDSGNRRHRRKRPAVRAADFPAYASIASDLEWAQMSQRHYEHLLRPALARLAATLNRPHVDLTGPPAGDTDGPGVNRATLERIVSELEAGEP